MLIEIEKQNKRWVYRFDLRVYLVGQLICLSRLPGSKTDMSFNFIEILFFIIISYVCFSLPKWVAIKS